MVSISACHAGDLGSIPSRDAILFLRNPRDKEPNIATSHFLLIKTKSWLDPRFLHLLDLPYTNPLNVEKTVLGLGLTVTLAVDLTADFFGQVTKGPWSIHKGVHYWRAC